MDISMSLIAEVLSDCSSRGWTVLPVEEEYTHLPSCCCTQAPGICSTTVPASCLEKYIPDAIAEVFHSICVCPPARLPIREYGRSECVCLQSLLLFGWHGRNSGR